jgi:hypothetical protein
MKPGPLDLPTIWRGCDWGPVTLKWKDKNGQPINLSGWYPVAQSLKINLNPTITDVGQGETQLALTRIQTKNLRLGVENWDWIWQRIQGQYRFPPFLAGKVQIKDPVSPVLGDEPPFIPPETPVAIAGTNVTHNSFRANWEPAERAIGYLLDVNTNANFGTNTFVPGYRNRDVGNIQHLVVVGLEEFLDYHYRLRAYNHGGTTVNSNVIHVHTLHAPPPGNDNFADNLPLPGLAGSTVGTTRGATHQDGEPPGAHTVWYRWRRPSTPVVSYWRLDDNANKIDIYKGDSLATLHLLASSVGDPPALSFIAGDDETIAFYRVRVSVADGSFGNPFTMHWTYAI